MSTALAERDDVTYDGEIIEARPAAPMTLFGTDDPTAVVERASAVATALASVINERRLYASISGKKHVQVEGWTLLGSMTGVFAEVVWSKATDDGWEARAVARTLAGQVVGAAEAMCTRREGKWRSADDYAIRSMSQTRAVSKALRMPLGFIMHLAGYDATPAEEIPTEQPEHRGARASSPSGAPASNQYRRSELATLMAEHRLDVAAVEATADRIGIPTDERPMKPESIDRLIAAIEQPSASVSADGVGPEEARASGPDMTTPDSQDASADQATPAAASSPPGGEPSAAPSLDDVLAVTGGELVPPKPGTDEYKALSNGTERAAARAYWEKHKNEQASLAEALGAPESDR